MTDFDLKRRSKYINYGFPRAWDYGDMIRASLKYDRLAESFFEDGTENRLTDFLLIDFPKNVVQRIGNESGLVVKVTNYNDLGITNYRKIDCPVTHDGYKWFAGLEFDISRLFFSHSLVWGDREVRNWNFEEVGKIVILFPQYTQTEDSLLVEQTDLPEHPVSVEEWEKILDSDYIPPISEKFSGIDRAVSFYGIRDGRETSYFIKELCRVFIETATSQ